MSLQHLADRLVPVALILMVFVAGGATAFIGA
jgi:hypothetical protein